MTSKMYDARVIKREKNMHLRGISCSDFHFNLNENDHLAHEILGDQSAHELPDIVMAK